MAAFRTDQVVGMREDLSDLISNVSRDDTPFMARCGATTMSNTYHEWETDSYATGSTSNAVIDGDDATIDGITEPTRVGNYRQISDKTAQISGGVEATKRAGRGREMVYQMMKKGRELKLDMEAILMNNQASVVGTGAVPSNLGGLPAWLQSNVDRGATGTSGGFSGGSITAATDGTQRAITVTLVDNVSRSIASNSRPVPNMTLMCGTWVKSQIAGFTVSGRTSFEDVKDGKLVGTIDVYTSPFHVLQVVHNVNQRSREAFLLNFDLLKVAYLRKFASWPLAKTGDSEKRQILSDYTLQVNNEKGLGVVADLLTS